MAENKCHGIEDILGDVSHVGCQMVELYNLTGFNQHGTHATSIVNEERLALVVQLGTGLDVGCL